VKKIKRERQTEQGRTSEIWK